ncbi:hypothetical protein Deba_1571 [Desulfarculus baarsii DSM 2075]|uniref:Uncharacterized protein n=1 Tax=Desulfarculus baarsii (strain ATCC 33931 / DSM 2075 / LMG 7858 / VKM B-1802 / 2st14) TaxID=644282 RepID=E1QH96_DESB2|nr:hypothetical protein [Desulfarculus baarsii]ADK84939.1 hypothetical protein Deba_1571 [Desulfarculus baarsii DSM 2075]
MRKLERYAFRDGVTPLSAEELNARFFDLDLRCHALEGLGVSWEDAVRQVQQVGLERINGLILPTLDQAGAMIDDTRRQWEHINQSWSDMVDTVDGAGQRLDATEAGLNAVGAALTQAGARIDVAEAGLDAVDAALTRAGARIDAADAALDAVGVALTQAGTRIDVAQAAADQALATLGRLGGYISGLQLRRHSDTQVLVRRGALEIGGRLYTLPNDTYVNAPTGSGFGWRYLAVRPPASGDTLTAPYCFGTFDPGLRPVHWAPGWVITENGHRVIGLYPGVGNAVVVFRTMGGRYVLPFHQTIIDTAAPPTASTEMAVGLPPFPDYLNADYVATIRNPGGPGVALVIGGQTAIEDSCGGATSRVASGGVSIRTTSGTAFIRLHGAGGAGTPNLLRLNMAAMDVPYGMAR